MKKTKSRRITFKTAHERDLANMLGLAFIVLLWCGISLLLGKDINLDTNTIFSLMICFLYLKGNMTGTQLAKVEDKLEKLEQNAQGSQEEKSSS